MIVATAGHIDHGKTALIKALTGVDADRLPEEKKRGITVDLGFAYQRDAAGNSLGFIDVPGHEKLVRTMLAGASGVDFVMLVVAADDGIMPQTREHLAILDLLGISRGIAVLSKVDKVTPERAGAVTAEIHALLAASSLADIDVLPVSAHRGDGVEDLRTMLAVAAAETGARKLSGGFRLAIDRAFTLSGAGLVVTGTVHAGRVGPGDRLLLAPLGREVRVRSLHAQNEAAEAGAAGQRCALNIAGPRVEKADIARGDWIVAPRATGADEPCGRAPAPPSDRVAPRSGIGRPSTSTSARPTSRAASRCWRANRCSPARARWGRSCSTSRPPRSPATASSCATSQRSAPSAAAASSIPCPRYATRESPSASRSCAPWSVSTMATRSTHYWRTRRAASTPRISRSAAISSQPASPRCAPVAISSRRRCRGPPCCSPGRAGTRCARKRSARSTLFRRRTRIASAPRQLKCCGPRLSWSAPRCRPRSTSLSWRRRSCGSASFSSCPAMR